MLSHLGKFVPETRDAVASKNSRDATASEKVDKLIMVRRNIAILDICNV